MGLKLLVNATEDFTGEFRKTANTQAQWKMNDSPSGDDTTLHDSSGHARNFTINGWSGTTASTRDGKLGKYFRFNTVNPETEKSHLRATNTGDFFTELGKRIVAGGWIYPTTYSVGTTFVPIFSTGSGPGNPLFYISLRSGRLRNMLYDASGTLIYDVIEPDPMEVVLQNNGAYFSGTVIDLKEKTVQSLVCDRSTGDVFQTEIRSFTGELNPSYWATRTNQNTDRALYERGAASKGCNLFISVHSNAVGNGVNESVDYPVAYVLLNGSSTDIGLKLAKVVESVMGTAQNGRTATRRGTNGEYYGVLRGANAVGTPGIIMEHSLGTQSRLKWELNCSLSSRQLKNIKFFPAGRLSSGRSFFVRLVSKFRVFPSVLNFREFFAGVCCWRNLYNP
ncbi:MAG: hypothetical protein ACLR7J_09210 [[Ruminococcus] torques]